MSPETVFSACTLTALLGWGLLIFRPAHPGAAWFASTMLPAALAVVYGVALLGRWGELEGGFGSLAAVSQLFHDTWALLAGWVHYLAFDLFVGGWIARDAARHRLRHAVVVPLLLLTLLLGPLGYLGYLALRWVRERTSPGRVPGHVEQRIAV